jgi:predicted Zn-dependent peptidase
VALVARSPARTTTVCAARTLTPKEGSDAAVRVLTRVLEQRLGQALREERGLTYDASASLIQMRHARLVLACSALLTDRLDDGVRTFVDTVTRLGTTTPDPAELEWAKAVLSSDVRSSNHELASIVELWTTELALGRRSPSARSTVDAIQAVTGDEVKALAARVLRGAPITWALSGEPAKVLPAVHRSGLRWNVVQVKP